MDKFYDKMIDAIREARISYEFNPNSYTFAAFQMTLATYQAFSEIEPLIRQRLSY